MQPNILLSFIVPVYNAENTLAKCIDSILAQPEKVFEIILLNDGSGDNSQLIIDKYVLENPSIVKAFIQENSGPGSTRNFGIQNANGIYIAFVDSDDYIEPNYINVVKTHIDEHDADMVIISYYRMYNRKQSLLERFHKFSNFDLYNQPIKIKTKPQMLCDIEVACWLRIVKRELFLADENLFFSSNSLAEDLEASLKWYINTKVIVVSPIKLYNYIIKTNTLNFNTGFISQYINIIESVCNYYKAKSQFNYYFEELEYMFAKHMLIANLLRLRASKQEAKFEQFITMRKSLLQYFPQYAKNKYFKNDPIYIRAAIYISYYFPKLFYPIL
ncbi:MAG: glycosyltransferase family 2 protein [Bacteroidetes bacterium]|nr:glycosyltransferase family 2 protein [Bacteroidota bacterium]